MQAQFTTINGSIYNKRGKPSMVRITRAGIIRFTVAAVQALQLKPGMLLEFLLFDIDKEIIYFCESEKGIPVSVDKHTRSKVQEEKGMYCCGRKLTPQLLDFFEIKTTSKTFDLTSDISIVNGQKCWFILKSKVHKPIKWRKK